MKNQLVSFINTLFVFVYSLFNNPQRIRLIVTIIAFCLIAAAILIPSLAIVADANPGGH